MDFSPFLQKAQNDNALVITCNEPLNLVILPFLSYRLVFCHTERSEVSIRCGVGLAYATFAVAGLKRKESLTAFFSYLFFVKFYFTKK